MFIFWHKTHSLIMNMDVLISDCSAAKLLSNISQPFLILKLIDNYFLLTKASPREPHGKNINFLVSSREYYSTFLRHVNLSYAAKLSELVDTLSIASHAALQHEWLMLYEIHDFSLTKAVHYKIGIPPYGAPVMVHSKNGGTFHCRVVNLFRLHSQAFYFLSCSPSHCEQFALITDPSSKILYGITYFIEGTTICVPFHSISSEKPCPISIAPEIKPLLQGTCYVAYKGNYCTGFSLSDGQVVSARHVLPFEEQKTGVEVTVRFYPYNEERMGQVCRIGEGNVDIVVVNVVDKIMVKKQTAMEERNASLDLRANYNKMVGKEIKALGFGKYNYAPRIFHKIELVMPTVQTGIVSKIVSLGRSQVFIKTDASLYNGFSGCAIWQRDQLIGMAIFIVKNKTNHSHFNRHNFSYTLGFIVELLRKNDKELLNSQVNEQLKLFDKIQLRPRINLRPKL